MTIRDNIARSFAGGPEFRILTDKIIVEPRDGSSLSEVADRVDEERPDILDESPVSSSGMLRARRALNDLGFNVRELNNVGLIVAETDSVAKIVQNITNAKDQFSSGVIKKLESVESRANKLGNRSLIGNFGGGKLNFSEDLDIDVELETNMRAALTDLSLNNPVTDAIREFDGIVNAELAFTRNTFGPRNLGVDVDALTEVFEEDDEKPGVGDALSKIGVDDAWGETRGEDAIVAVFDTSFCGDFLNSDRVIDTFSGDGVDSAFSAPSEGHGTMTAYSAAGNRDESGLGFDGAAPEAGMLLGRVTDSEGSLSLVEEAWDWLIPHIRNEQRPIVSNHSYGVPLCSARTMDMCNSTTTKLVRIMNRRSDHQAFYAAGNEALYCGHRLGGFTNGINGVNSDPTSITVGALRYDLQDAQNYSSHGFGTCASVSNNPKPDVSCLLPSLIPYGCKVKDMSSGRGGSSGGTSEATPITCGVGALIASVTGDAQRGKLEDILEGTASVPRKTQINLFRGHDARFGNGQIDASKAIDEAKNIAGGEVRVID